MTGGTYTMCWQTKLAVPSQWQIGLNLRLVLARPVWLDYPQFLKAGRSQPEPVNSLLKNSIWAEKMAFRLRLRQTPKMSSTGLYRPASGHFARLPRLARKSIFSTPKRVFQETANENFGHSSRRKMRLATLGAPVPCFRVIRDRCSPMDLALHLCCRANKTQRDSTGQALPCLTRHHPVSSQRSRPPLGSGD